MFTLSATAQEFSICLRCESRLSWKRSCRSSRRPQFRAARQSRVFASGAGQRRESAQAEHKEESLLTTPPIRYEPSTKSHRHGAFRPPSKESLGVESLGAPAEVLVVRKSLQAKQDMGAIFFTKESSRPLPPALEDSPDALLNGIEASRGTVDIDQVCVNIESVRDGFLESQGSKERYVAAEEYDKLLSRLSGGFQKMHLAEYWRRSCSELSVDALDLHFPYRSTLLARTEWRSEILPDEKDSPPSLMDRNDVPKISRQPSASFINNAKKSLAERIIQKCWGFQKKFDDEQDGKLGEMVMRLPHEHLRLLLVHCKA